MPFIVNPNFYNVVINGQLILAAPGYLDNDLSTVGTVTAPTFFDAPDHGTWLALGRRELSTYTPDAGFTGVDTVLGSISNTVVTKKSIITFEVYDPADPSFLHHYPNFYNVAVNGVADRLPPGYLDNDFSTGGTLTAPTLLDAPDHGTWTALVDGSFTYTPDANFTGVDTVLVSVSNGSVTKTETVTFNVYAPNDAPLLHTNIGLTVLEGASNVIGASKLDFNDDEQVTTAITYTLTSVTANGTLFNNGSALGTGGTFTQADINSGLISYSHNGSDTTATPSTSLFLTAWAAWSPASPSRSPSRRRMMRRRSRRTAAARPRRSI